MKWSLIMSKTLIKKSIYLIKDFYRRIDALKLTPQNQSQLIVKQRQFITEAMRREQSQQNNLNTINEQNLVLIDQIQQMNIEALINAEKLDLIKRLTKFYTKHSSTSTRHADNSVQQFADPTYVIKTKLLNIRQSSRKWNKITEKM